MSRKMYSAQEIKEFIEEFRANGGRPAGRFEGATLLLLDSGPEADGSPHVSPLNFYAERGRYFVFAANDGADEDPHWMEQLRADPNATIEVDGQVLRVTATELHGAERSSMYARQARRYPQFEVLQEATSRVIPVVELVPAGNS
ncbi:MULTISPECIES: nitroreductase/quinone reductase family protein [unclassified Parafrankia]|uniref:nitroreductase/quinone reductase family protein n=1 Tax=unclassified Parafrankia TaxID=2994368 RepID=UPI000DA50F35|nr:MULTISPECIES: nitroreductase/quinone reductase family protein [unclassified Parafrankia]TCJ34779.1 nitroreductase family deazaflavin-dependent oxidoreductase [Parafrankia sp. BMG5.11]CAI7977208.1 F420H(2)-dependent quinone reductase [Frankia sp. Hr75.2]SQD98842.1 Pyridoxamine 5'-phosphate oxidase-related FMN-binding [Parafrankia sp. Ea1.12]